MKHIITLLICLVVSGFTPPPDKEYYATGELLSETVFDSTCNCDHYTEYYKSGQKRRTTNYIHSGMLNSNADGELIYYFESGIIANYTFKRNGVSEGREYANFNNGQLGYEHFYKDGFKYGTWRYYNEDKTLREEQYFVSGKTPWNSDLDFTTNNFYSLGRLAYTETISAGRRSALKIVDSEAYEKLQAIQPPIGQRLFNANCAMCHTMNTDVVGPKLEGVTIRRKSDWLRKMIINGNNLISQGDSSAVALYQQWSGTQHPNFERLDDEEVNAIVGYMDKFR